MVREFGKLIAPYARRIRLMTGRGIIRLVNDATKEQETQLSLLADEVRDKVERYQHYGFTSHPHASGEAIYLSLGGSRDHVVIIADGDRRYRLKGLATGEVALYDDQGQVVHLKRDGVEVTSPTRITATAPEVTIAATTKVTMTTPLCEISGNLQVGGDITADGNVADAGGNKTMAGMRATYNGHTHPETGTGGGTTSQPTQGM